MKSKRNPFLLCCCAGKAGIHFFVNPHSATNTLMLLNRFAIAGKSRFFVPVETIVTFSKLNYK
jgi:hypothetical protein